MPRIWFGLAWLAAAATTVLAWFGWQRPDLVVALMGWVSLCL